MNGSSKQHEKLQRLWVRTYKGWVKNVPMIQPQIKTKPGTEREISILSEENECICSFATNAPGPWTSSSVFLAVGTPQKQQKTQNKTFFQILVLE